MNDRVFQELIEASWRRPLTPEEEARLQSWLAAHPEGRADWESEAALSQMLRELAPAPAVSSNFTTLVLQTVERDSSRNPAWSLSRILRGWLPRMAVGMATIVVCLGIHQRHVENSRRAIASSLTEVSSLYRAAATNPEALEDFEPIRCLGKLQPKADTELLALLQ
jgi:ferric-dicitrate binding protein FerR (iron transport regulator)